jgi:peptidoglycan/xylan/chitin deacetylase (PgdA/CDA1 family)
MSALPSIVTTSWDDGSPCDQRLAELLEKYGLPGTFYVPFTSPHGVMAPAELRRLAGRFEIGAHTMTHLNLNTAPTRTAYEEIASSRRWIEDVTGRECRMFCFPAGRFRREHVAMLCACGFLGGRTAEVLSLGFPRRQHGVSLMPTTIQAFPHSPADYLRNLVKRRSVAALPAWLLALRRPAWPALARLMFERALERGGIFHLWGHSWEIEEQNAWGPLEELLAYLSQWRSRVAYLSNLEVCQYVVPG